MRCGFASPHITVWVGIARALEPLAHRPYVPHTRERAATWRSACPYASCRRADLPRHRAEPRASRRRSVLATALGTFAGDTCFINVTAIRIECPTFAHGKGLAARVESPAARVRGGLRRALQAFLNTHRHLVDGGLEADHGGRPAKDSSGCPICRLIASPSVCVLLDEVEDRGRDGQRLGRGRALPQRSSLVFRTSSGLGRSKRHAAVVSDGDAATLSAVFAPADAMLAPTKRRTKKAAPPYACYLIPPPGSGVPGGAAIEQPKMMSTLPPVVSLRSVEHAASHITMCAGFAGSS